MFLDELFLKIGGLGAKFFLHKSTHICVSSVQTYLIAPAFMSCIADMNNQKVMVH